MEIVLLSDSDGYDDASYDAGVASVDITVDNQEAYDEGYSNALILSTEITISLTQGWNMMSSLPFPVDVSNIQDPNGIIQSGTIYGYDVLYYEPESLNPGEGFWIRANDDGAITLVSSGENNSNSGSNLLKLR